jgi:putative tryptophan/tyrosine transport system substrate-binding protein
MEEATMTRRIIGLLVTLALGLLAAPLTAAGPPGKMPRVGVLDFDSPPASPDWKTRSLFLQELRKLGWLEGQNLVLEYRWAEGRGSRLYTLAAELVRLPVDVIVVSNSLAIRAAKQETTTIPIVMISVGDPVESEFVADLAWPGGNITGVGGVVPKLSGKLLELLKEAIPAVTRIAVLADLTAPATGQILEELEVAAQALGVQLQVVAVYHAREFEHSLKEAIQAGSGALVVLPAVLFGSHQKQIAALALQHGLPAIFSERGFAQVGGLMAYGPERRERWQRVAYYVDRILKGAKPADLPVQQPMKFELVINLKTAQALGLTIPPTLLFQADEAIR